MMRESGIAMVSRRHVSSVEQQGARVRHPSSLGIYFIARFIIFVLAKSTDPAISRDGIHSVHLPPSRPLNATKKLGLVARETEKRGVP